MSTDNELPGMWEEADLSGGWADTDGMSTRERLVKVLEHTSTEYLDARFDPERNLTLDKIARLLLERHAHELAEKIRENTRAGLTRVTSVRGADWGRTWAHGRERAADLIDPEVESSG